MEDRESADCRRFSRRLESPTDEEVRKDRMGSVFDRISPSEVVVAVVVCFDEEVGDSESWVFAIAAVMFFT